MKPILSVIVPCYNVSQYISKCLDSIFACGLQEQEYEVICINDGSKDDTLAILHHIESLHTNMSVIDFNTNQGLSVGRNAGLMAAQGDYVWFVDSDDTIEPANVVNMLNNARNENLDVLLFNYTDLNEDGSIIPPIRLFKDSEIMNGEDFVDALFGTSIVYYMGYVVRFLVRKQYLFEKNIVFPEKKHWEDTVWMPKVLLLANRVQSTSLCGYYYWHHETSICGSFYHAFPAHLLYERCFDTVEQLMDFSKELGNSKYAQVMWNAAINRYLNKMPLYLFRSNNHERHAFAKILKTNKKEVDSFRPYMNWLTKFMTSPLVGLVVSDVLSWCYQFTHGKKYSYI